MLEPYQLFLGWIRKLYYAYFSDETPEQFAKNAKVYPMQQFSFAEYIRTGKADRKEDIMMIEITYETKRMLGSLVNVYKYICSKIKLFVVIESQHLANLSGVKVLYQMMHENFHGAFRLVATYNESYHVPEYIQKTWEEFLNAMEEQGYQYEWGAIEANVTIDAQYYLNIIYDKIKHSNLVVTDDQYTRFLQLIALTEMYCKEYSKALQKTAKNKEILFHFNRGVELATEIENYELLISAYTKNIVVFSRVGCYDYVEDEDKYWLDTLFMKYLLETMMAVAEGRLQEAKQKFDEAENIMNMDKEKRYFSFLFFYMYRKGLFGIQTIVRSYRSLSGGYLVCSTALWK